MRSLVLVAFVLLASCSGSTHGVNDARAEAASDASVDDTSDCTGGFVCGDGVCLTMDQVCDGVRQCMDGSDESTAAGCQAPCTGCISNGACVDGTDPAACGRNGVACVACGAGESCAQGECLVPPSCGSSNCPSGCCVGDQCMPGTSLSACGGQGLMCATCGSGESCMNGVCRPPCGPSTCTGCCQPDGTCTDGSSDSMACGQGGTACTSCSSGTTCAGGTCVDNACLATCTGCCGVDPSTGMMGCLGPIDAWHNDSYCGRGGGVCASCSASESCRGGACVSTAASDACPNGCLDASNVCQPGTSDAACGARGVRCATCTGVLSCTSAQECNLPPDSLWDFIVYNGSVPPMNGTSAWDPFGGLPDPRIEFEALSTCCSPFDAHGPTVDNTLSPNWGGAVVAAAVPYRNMWYNVALTMVDDDGVYNDTIGICGFEQNSHDPATLQSIFGGTIQTCRNNGAWFRWQVVPHR